MKFQLRGDYYKSSQKGQEFDLRCDESNWQAFDDFSQMSVAEIKRFLQNPDFAHKVKVLVRETFQFIFFKNQLSANEDKDSKTKIALKKIIKAFGLKNNPDSTENQYEIFKFFGFNYSKLSKIGSKFLLNGNLFHSHVCVHRPLELLEQIKMLKL